MQVYVNECYNIEDQANSCYLHPDETFVGVCHLCLNERLIILASLSKQSMYYLHRRSFNFCSDDNNFFSSGYSDKKQAFKKIFSLGSSIFHGQNKFSEFPTQNHEFDDSVSTSSQEDSYISFKIEENGLASWEKNYTSGTMQSDNKTFEDIKNDSEAEKHTNNNIQEMKNVSELENLKNKQTDRTRWHDWIGKLIKKKGSMRGWMCQVSIDKVVEGVKIRKVGWLRTLTMRRESKKD